MAATGIFCVRRKSGIAHNTFLYLFMKPATALRLRGEIVVDDVDPLRYHFRVDGTLEAVKDLLAYASIGAPAFGPMFDIELWDGDEVVRGPEALLLRPSYLLIPPATDDAVVPQRD